MLKASRSRELTVTPCAFSARTIRETRVKSSATGSWSGRKIARSSACKPSAVPGTEPAVDGEPDGPAGRDSGAVAGT